MMDKSDYEEPRCPMDNSMWVKKKVTPIPEGRVISREDEYLGRKDYAGAERHLIYWLGEAEQGNDGNGKLLIFNELMGIYRKTGKGEKAKEYAQKAIALSEEMEIADTVQGATAYLNAGTVYKAFGEPAKSLEYFEKCRAVYEAELDAFHEKKAGLYNNMALTLVDLGRFDEARELYAKALEITEKTSKADEAITYLNLADCIAAEKGLEKSVDEIQNLLDKAEEALNSVPEEQWDGYYAFVCEKCWPVFDSYGNFLAAGRFRKISEAIYEANS